MGGDGSGNQGRRKFKGKFYDYTGGFETKSTAEHSAKQYESNGIKTEIVHETFELPWYPHKEVLGWTLWTWTGIYHRPSRSTKSRLKDGTRPRY